MNSYRIGEDVVRWEILAQSRRIQQRIDEVRVGIAEDKLRHAKLAEPLDCFNHARGKGIGNQFLANIDDGVAIFVNLAQDIILK